MNRSFHPFFSKQNALRAQLENLQAQYDLLVTSCDALEVERDALNTQVTQLQADLKAAKYHGKKKPVATSQEEATR